ncbi:monovalent cation/H+ antiporter complex subunit F [Salinimonas chungwhensis]|uniref:monovalent cation/H+ antiporter complex subunit F n=1 Tax=Salinimonas chungwhensis TaxID=265425 RepID=UPI00037B7586|nr:monovalent cation/H+ antiporter complex subunit F [Salinimonas chungwhensis]
MNALYGLFGIAFLFCLLFGLIRVIIGPEQSDRMLAVQLFSTTGIGFLIMLFLMRKDSAILDVALIMALLGSLVFIAYAVFKQPKEPLHDDDH